MDIPNSLTLEKIERDGDPADYKVVRSDQPVHIGRFSETAKPVWEEIVRRYNIYEDLVDILQYVRNETSDGFFSSGDLVEELLRRIEAVETNHEIDLSPPVRPIEDLPFREGDYIKIPERHTIGYVTELRGIDDTWLFEIQVCGLVDEHPPEVFHQEIRLDELEEDPRPIRMDT